MPSPMATDIPAARPDAATTTDLAAQVRVATLRFSRRLRAERDESVSDAQFSVLAALTHHGSLTPSELATHEQVRGPSMSHTIDCLEQAGLVQRTRGHADGRRVDVVPTETGSDLVAHTAELRNRWLGSELVRLTDDERATLHAAAQLMQRMVSR